MALKTKLYRVQVLITKPAGKYEKVKGISNVFFYLAERESDVKDDINRFLEHIRAENNNDQTIYIKTLNIKQERFSGIKNLVK